MREENVEVGIAIQLGLDISFELGFLGLETYEGFPDKHSYSQTHYHWSLCQPTQSQFERFGDHWHVYGIDAQPPSIDFMSRKYRTEDVHLICAAIHNDQRILYNDVQQGFSLFDMSWGTKSVSTAALRLTELFAQLNLTQIQVLACDIEGEEISTFLHYDWHIIPEVLSVEFHMHRGYHPDRHRIHEVIELILEKGYTIAAEKVYDGTKIEVGEGLEPFPNQKEVRFIHQSIESHRQRHLGGR